MCDELLVHFSVLHPYNSGHNNSLASLNYKLCVGGTEEGWWGIGEGGVVKYGVVDQSLKEL